ncbi:hypothetical protein F7725_018369 [Dissostichus mawsoni]|uniref:Uncharacterized protein n=1 Tax=Dissostichus mawsoni TaxID=36200 RepID=A0A7J5XRD9_DISMA|nr:hypothetical protein F7725_018369 [Dissostichus mawsoni]
MGSYIRKSNIEQGFARAAFPRTTSATPIIIIIIIITTILIIITTEKKTRYSAHPPSTPYLIFFPPSRSLWECDALRISEIRSLQVQQQKSDHDASFLLTDGERDNRPSHNLHQQQLSSEKERKREREQE